MTVAHVAGFSRSCGRKPATNSAGSTRSTGLRTVDHTHLSDGVERARAKLEYIGYGAALAGETFTISELHAIYEAVWGSRLDRANFQRKVLGTSGFLTETGQHSSGSIGRPARLYRGRANVILIPFFLRE